MEMHWVRATLVLLIALASACGGAPRRFTQTTPIWVDDDRHPFGPQPEARFAPEIWDAVDNMVIRPGARFFAFETHGESENVNAWDEVPDSSWFTNRIGRRPMSLEEIAAGPCAGVPLPEPPWRVTGGKVDGATAGFVFEDATGRRFVLKSDRAGQPEQATAADAIGSRLYHAVGYWAPCNQIVRVDPSWLTIDAEAEIERGGSSRHMTADDLQQVIEGLTSTEDGTYRGLASAFIPGTPLGPWDFRGTWDRDLNDVVDHQNRRELRAMFVLNAWIDNWDSRQANTLSSWLPAGDDHGYVRHYMVDFGATLGFVQGLHRQQTRYGRSEWLDTRHIAEDLLTFGIPTRTWDVVPRTPTWPVFGYFDVEHFDPADWRPNYFNGAFEQCTERDGAWMARILARLDQPRMDAIIAEGRLSDPTHRRYLRYALEGRRLKTLERWLVKLSPLADPVLEADGHVCLTDLAVTSGLREAPSRSYAGWRVDDGGDPGEPVTVRSEPGRVCFTHDVSDYEIVRIRSRSQGEEEENPLDVHLRRVDGALFVVGLERLTDDGGVQ